MMNSVRSVHMVSDGILVDFLNGTQCYYPASFLLEHVNRSCNQVFLGYDPSLTYAEPEFGDLKPAMTA